MDAAMILVLILTAGVVALLAWFEINSRRNEALKESKSALAQPTLESLNTRTERGDDSTTHRRKVA